MDTIGYLVFGYMLFGLVLIIVGVYLDQRLLRYVFGRYPEEGRVIRSHEGNRYPWSVGNRTLRALINKQSSNDPELAHMAQKVKHYQIYFMVWFVLALIMFFTRVLFFIVK